MRKIVLVFFALLLCGGANLFGQDATGRVIGIVTDPSGAAIPGVKVTVTNTGTQVARDTTTDQNGYYQVLDVPIGFYSVTAESSSKTDPRRQSPRSSSGSCAIRHFARS